MTKRKAKRAPSKRAPAKATWWKGLSRTAEPALDGEGEGVPLTQFQRLDSGQRGRRLFTCVFCCHATTRDTPRGHATGDSDPTSLTQGLPPPGTAQREARSGAARLFQTGGFRLSIRQHSSRKVPRRCPLGYCLAACLRPMSLDDRQRESAAAATPVPRVLRLAMSLETCTSCHRVTRESPPALFVLVRYPLP